MMHESEEKNDGAVNGKPLPTRQLQSTSINKDDIVHHADEILSDDRENRHRRAHHRHRARHRHHDRAAKRARWCAWK
jgi:hypothetical protein